jgi:hypothetical protein
MSSIDVLTRLFTMLIPNVPDDEVTEMSDQLSSEEIALLAALKTRENIVKALMYMQRPKDPS